MGTIFRNGREYTKGQMPGYVPNALRATSDRLGNRIDRKYLKLSNFRTSSSSINPDKELIEVQNNAGFHNSFYRGEDITDKFQDGTLYTEIYNGTFEDIFVGDYFTATIHGMQVVCRIAGFDIHKNSGYPSYLSRHSAVIVPDIALTTAAMKGSNTTDGGFTASTMLTTTLPMIDGWLATTFGDHLLGFQYLFSTTLTSSAPSRAYAGMTGAMTDWAWYSPTVKSCLLTEVEAFGAISCSSSAMDVANGMAQFPLFRLVPEHLILRDGNGTRLQWYLRAAASSSAYVIVDSDGKPSYQPASTVLPIRPYWLIG